METGYLAPPRLPQAILDLIEEGGRILDSDDAVVFGPGQSAAPLSARHGVLRALPLRSLLLMYRRGF